MKWFGKSWNAPVCQSKERVKIPVKEKCFHCGKKFTRHDKGIMLPFISESGKKLVPYHLDCLLYSMGIITKNNKFDKDEK